MNWLIVIVLLHFYISSLSTAIEVKGPPKGDIIRSFNFQINSWWRIIGRNIIWTNCNYSLDYISTSKSHSFNPSLYQKYKFKDQSYERRVQGWPKRHIETHWLQMEVDVLESCRLFGARRRLRGFAAGSQFERWLGKSSSWFIPSVTLTTCKQAGTASLNNCWPSARSDILVLWGSTKWQIWCIIW